jgi:hypothetical protein
MSDQALNPNALTLDQAATLLGAEIRDRNYGP